MIVQGDIRLYLCHGLTLTSRENLAFSLLLLVVLSAIVCAVVVFPVPASPFAQTLEIRYVLLPWISKTPQSAYFRDNVMIP